VKCTLDLRTDGDDVFELKNTSAIQLCFISDRTLNVYAALKVCSQHMKRILFHV